MNFDGAVNLQREILDKIFGFTEIASASSSEGVIPTLIPERDSIAFRDIVIGRRKKKRDPRDLVALGVLPPEGGNRNPDALKMGIFIQRQDLRQSQFVERIQSEARGESRIIYTGKIVRRGLFSDRCRPLVIGSSVGHYRVSAGTIACFCRHSSGAIGILSNNHILADTNKAKIGDVVIQPGRADGGREPDDRVASLYNFIPIDFSPDSRNLVDCAFATLLGDIEHEGTSVRDPDAAAQWSVGTEAEDLLVRDSVKKLGRTTRLTNGVVTAINVNNLNVAMILGNGERLARFDNQIAIEGSDQKFSDRGDSGSLVFAENGAPAALLFAGSDKGGLSGKGVTFASPIGAVLTALNLEIHRASGSAEI